ncbi:MAG: DUF378 domain-containing protein [Candidatus Omnitrophica bacterium CG11_big_fil_rev_8_21_14_0_20_63_9]|nr:MAG: DUF378 domain-containing protein [Candidatus Omnitrophica bacterium CG11_big_fil_rev_8_21_14_0_20_63_9]
MSGGKGCCGICKIVGLLVGIGALNWGLVAIFQLDLVAKLLGDMTTAAKVVYTLIGIAGLIKLVSLVKACPCCSGKSCETKS